MGQNETRPALARIRLGIGPQRIIAIENSVDLFGINARALILDTQIDRGARPRQGHGNRTIGGRESNRVVENILDHLLENFLAGLNEDPFLEIPRDADPVLGHHLAVAKENIADNHADIDAWPRLAVSSDASIVATGPLNECQLSSAVCRISRATLRRSSISPSKSAATL